MAKCEIIITNKRGLAARSAAKLVQAACRYNAEIWLECRSRRVDAKSVMGVMLLGARPGSTIAVEAHGKDEEQAVKALRMLAEQRFGEAA